MVCFRSWFALQKEGRKIIIFIERKRKPSDKYTKHTLKRKDNKGREKDLKHQPESERCRPHLAQNKCTMI